MKQIQKKMNILLHYMSETIIHLLIISRKHLTQKATSKLFGIKYKFQLQMQKRNIYNCFRLSSASIISYRPLAFLSEGRFTHKNIN